MSHCVRAWSDKPGLDGSENKRRVEWSGSKRVGFEEEGRERSLDSLCFEDFGICFMFPSHYPHKYSIQQHYMIPVYLFFIVHRINHEK